MTLSLLRDLAISKSEDVYCAKFSRKFTILNLASRGYGGCNILATLAICNCLSVCARACALIGNMGYENGVLVAVEGPTPCCW